MKLKNYNCLVLILNKNLVFIVSIIIIILNDTIVFVICFPLQWLNPVEFLEDLIVEHTYVECTASAIEAFTLFKKLYPHHRKKEIENFIVKAVQYIEDEQTADGSWFSFYFFNIN